MTDYFKDNPRVLCPVCKEHTFRRKAFNRNGEERVYSQCQECFLKSKGFDSKGLPIKK
jgi:hypothetical protein